MTSTEQNVNLSPYWRPESEEISFLDSLIGLGYEYQHFGRAIIDQTITQLQNVSETDLQVLSIVIDENADRWVTAKSIGKSLAMRTVLAAIAIYGTYWHAATPQSVFDAEWEEWASSVRACWQESLDSGRITAAQMQDWELLNFTGPNPTNPPTRPLNIIYSKIAFISWLITTGKDLLRLLNALKGDHLTPDDLHQIKQSLHLKTNLREFKLKGHRFNGNHIDAMVEFITRNRSVCTLCLVNCNLTDDQAIALVVASFNNPILRCLDLTENTITAAGITAIRDLVLAHERANRVVYLTELKLTQVGHAPIALPYLSDIRRDTRRIQELFRVIWQARLTERNHFTELPNELIYQIIGAVVALEQLTIDARTAINMYRRSNMASATQATAMGIKLIRSFTVITLPAQTGFWASMNYLTSGNLAASKIQSIRLSADNKHIFLISSEQYQGWNSINSGTFTTVKAFSIEGRLLYSNYYKLKRRERILAACPINNVLIYSDTLEGPCVRYLHPKKDKLQNYNRYRPTFFSATYFKTRRACISPMGDLIIIWDEVQSVILKLADDKVRYERILHYKDQLNKSMLDATFNATGSLCAYLVVNENNHILCHVVQQPSYQWQTHLIDLTIHDAAFSRDLSNVTVKFVMKELSLAFKGPNKILYYCLKTKKWLTTLHLDNIRDHYPLSRNTSLVMTATDVFKVEHHLNNYTLPLLTLCPTAECRCQNKQPVIDVNPLTHRVAIAHHDKVTLFEF